MGQIADGLLAADDGAIRAALGQELTRLKAAEPAAALGLSPDAASEEIRARFLALAKIYHPNRFARRPADVIKLANEVFLHLRRAYQRASERPPAANERAAAAPAAVSSAAVVATVAAARASDVSPPSQPKLDVEAALARRRRARSQPLTTITAGTRPASTPPPPSLEQGPRRDEGQRVRFESALVDLRQGRLPGARTSLRALVAESPSDLEYRAYLHYVTGRMHESAGRAAEAVVEYDRALGFDPDMDLARRSRQSLAGNASRGGAPPFNRSFRK